MNKIIFGLALLSVSAATYAQGDSMDSRVTGTMPEGRYEESKNYKWNMGIISGVNSPKGDITSSAEYGVNLGFQPAKQLAVGLDVMSSKLDDANQNQRTTGLVSAAYVIGGDVPVIRNTYIGAGGGPVFVDNKVKWAYAPLVGFDVPLTQKTHEYMSLGLAAKYVFNQDTPDSLSAGAAVKYWF